MNSAIILSTPVVLGVVMFIVIELGRRFGLRRAARDLDGLTLERQAVTATDGAMFALLGLMIAFTFSGASSRFDLRRERIVAEANAIGTAWLRLDILPATAQPAVRAAFRDYVDARLAIYGALPDEAAARAAADRVAPALANLWRLVMEAGEGPAPDRLLITAINDMFDIGTERFEAMLMHPPLIIFVLLLALATGCALLVGISMAGAPRRPLLHQLAFVLLISVTVYVIFDLEFPRMGLIRVDATDHVLLELRAAMR